MNVRNAPKVAPVVSQVSGLVTDHLDDECEEWNGKDEGREQQMELRDRPDGHAAPDDGEGSVLGLDVLRCPSGRFRCCSLGGESLHARRGVNSRGRSAVRLGVLAVRQERGDDHDTGEHHDAGEGTKNEQQFAVHRAVH
jgi:hypothetical protein